MTELFSEKEQEFVQSWSGTHQALLYGLMSSITDKKLQDTLLYIDTMFAEQTGLTDEQREVFFHVVPTCLKAAGPEFQDELLKSLKAKDIDFLTVK